MREVFDVKCGRPGASGLLSAPCGNGLLTPHGDRLRQLVRRDSIHDVYQVEHLPFARGQFATVRKCTHKVTGQRFAAKFLRKRRRLTDVYHEIAVLDAFADCDRIVHLHEVYETNTEIIIVLELVTGGEMQTLLDVEEFIRENDVIRLMQQILEGLQQLHDSDIAHLDIKPQNLLLTGPFPTCDVKLCDFGISRQIAGGGELREIMGTADYMAPEILNYEPLSLATDMWSIGVLTYALLTGYTPFTGANVQETYCNITSEEVDFPADLFVDVSDSAKDFISGLLVKNPSGRNTIHDCLKHSWLLTSSPPSVPVMTSSAPLCVPSRELSEEKDSGFSSSASSDDETSLPYTNANSTGSSSSKSLPAPPPLPQVVDNNNTQARSNSCSNANRFGSTSPAPGTITSTITGAYTIANLLPIKQQPQSSPPAPPVAAVLVDNVPASAQVAPPPPPAVATPATPTATNTVSLNPLTSTVHHPHQHHHQHHHEDEVSDATSEASSDRTSDMSWEETEFSYRRLSVAQLTDRVWDCFNEHDFASEHVRPWEHVCTGAVGRAKAMFQKAAPSSPAPSPCHARASAAAVAFPVRATPPPPPPPPRRL